MYKTEVATQDELQNWDRIISDCPYSESLHTSEWRNALKESFSQLEPVYLVTRDETGDIAAALPCFCFQPVPFSRTLLSMPWTLPGGPLILPGADAAEATLSICRKLDEIAGERRPFEMAFTLPTNCDNNIRGAIISAGYTEESSQFTHILELHDKYGEIRKGYEKGTKAAVTQARKYGVTVRETDKEVDVAYFYQLYLAQMRHFGSTPKPYSLFDYLRTSPMAQFAVAELDDQIISGVLFLHFNSRVRFWCQVSDPNFLKKRPNNATIDYMIRWSGENGYRFLDFGASPPDNKGLISFKEHWGAKMAWFSTFSKLYSSWRKKIWTVPEPVLRRAYAAIQRFKIRRV